VYTRQYLSGGALVHLHHKVYLPTYRLFDDARYFGPGTQLRAFDTRFGRMGFLICEDAWHLSSGLVLWQDGADIFLHIASNPGYGVQPNGKFVPNENAAHEAGESAAREAQENAGQVPTIP